MEKVSVIVPTANREFHVLNLIQFFLKQTYPNKELIIWDDSPKISDTISELCARYENIHYFYEAERLPLGIKLNKLVDQASGSIIVMFDDDDYYAPVYIERMVETLNRQDLDFVTLSKWFSYSSFTNQFFYWETDRMFSTHYFVEPSKGVSQVNFPDQNNHLLRNWLWGYGWKYVFRKKVFEQVRFREMEVWEEGKCVDFWFYETLAERHFKLGHFPDLEGIALHILHKGNSSGIFPQYLLPNVFLPVFFKEFNISQVLQ